MKKYLLIAAVLILVIVIYLFSISPTYTSIDISTALINAKSSLKQNQELIVFESKNPFNFYDIFNRSDEISNQKVFGILSKPDSVGVYPVIIALAGSVGWSDHHYGYLNRYLDMGFAVFSLHSFTSRNIESTVGEQLSVTIPMMLYDAFMALNKLSEDSSIDINRAGITGWSLGGGVALFSAWAPIQEKISPKFKFAAHLPIYPPCIITPKELRFTNAPVHILAGELDDWVPAQACEEFVESVNKLGYNFEITVYQESHHSFDSSMDVMLNENAYSFTDCRLELANNGVVRTLYGMPLSTPIMQNIGLFFCAEKGAHWGGNKEARNNASVFAIDFMKFHLLN